MMTSSEIRTKYITFFESKGHKHIPSAPLIPEHDPTVLFTTAGMHPLVPYLMGEVHPEGARLVSYQKCIRTTDIDEVGDNTHLTFFEMLGNWSIGDYFKKEAIEWSFEFLTAKEWLQIDINYLAISVFIGDNDAPRDEESASIWQDLGIPKERIAYLDKENNWWGPAGQTGPCGPDTEIFYWLGEETPPKQFVEEDKRWVEIWNNVFMQYNKKSDGRFEPLKQKNVDTGMGLERIASVLQNKQDVYETDLFVPIITAIEQMIVKRDAGYERYKHIIADHIKAATFILGDQYGIAPSNEGQGYILRRLIRRAIRYAHQLGIEQEFLVSLAKVVIEQFSSTYPELQENKEFVYDQLRLEEQKFKKTVRKGLREFERLYYIDLYSQVLKKLAELYPEGDLPFIIKEHTSPMILKHFNSYISATSSEHVSISPQGQVALDEELSRRETFIRAVLRHSPVIEQELSQQFSKLSFTLYDTYGFPYELTKELGKEKGIVLDDNVFKIAYAMHQKKSRQGAEHKFAGGLADISYETKRLHTATHLLHQALRTILGDHVKQKGSNITRERLRFDFSHPNALSKEEVRRVEDLVNQKLEERLPVSWKEVSLEEAREMGAIGLFEERYEARVKVYSIGDFSKEICGGPHVENTYELGKFKIIKEESCGAGVRRIKAVLG